MRFLRQLGASTLAALFGAALFAVHPQLGASTGWLAARCGIGAATMTLLTAVLWMSARRREREHQSSALLKASALFAAALAPLFQESGYLALLTPLMLDLFLSKSSAKSLLRRHSMFATLGIGLLTLRYVAIGTLGGGYPNPMGLLAGGEAAQDALASGGKTLVRMVGAIPIEFFDSNRLLQIACLALTLLTVTMSLLLVRKKKGTALLRTTPPLLNPALALLALAALQFILLLLTSNPTLVPATGHRWYLALAFGCGALALCAAPLFERRGYAGPAILLFACYLGGHLVVQKQLREGDKSVKKVLLQLDAIGEKQDLPKGPMMVSCLPEARWGIPTFHWGLREAINPPFRPKAYPRTVYPIHRFMYLGGSKGHALHPPIEALLYALGYDPVMVTMKDPHVPHSDDLSQYDFTLPTGDPAKPYVAVPREEVAKYVASLFSPKTVEVLTPELTSVARLPLSLRVSVNLEGAVSAELFAFLPTFDTRIEMPARDGVASIEVGKKLSDYLRFHGGETDVFLIVVAYEDSAKTRRRLSPLITVRVTP
jgi:hypothetical protein